MSKKRKLDTSEVVRETSRKKSRHYSEQDRKLASFYDSLADESNDVRIKAAKDLLLELQPQMILGNGNIIDTVLKRLIRGLCSGRKAARFGFFIALTELLSALYGENSKYSEDKIPPIEKLPDLIENLTQPEGDVAGQVSTYFLHAGTLKKYSNPSVGEKRSHLRPHICVQSFPSTYYSCPFP